MKIPTIFKQHKIQFKAIFIALVVLTQVISPVAKAVDNQFYSSNDIFYYNPDATKCPTATDTGATTGSLNGNDNLQKVYNYMLGKGLSPVQAAGVVGNISQESGGDPTNSQVGPDTKDPSIFGTAVGIGKAWGLIQWDAGGRAIEYAKKAGVTGPIYELTTQLDIVWWQMNHETPTSAPGFMPQYKTTTTVEQATLLYEQKMEGAGSPVMTNRIAAAKLAMNYAKNPSVSISTDGSGGCAGAVSGDVVTTALNYAWPTTRPGDKTKKPAYEEAIKKAQAAGKYIGDTCYGGGVDCGAFITRVMQDSGADPDYGGGGNTTYQLKHALESGKYIHLSPKSSADLQPGDIAIQDNNQYHHTYMYVGKQPGFATDIASASQCDHAPMAGTEKAADPAFEWFRLKQ